MADFSGGLLPHIIHSALQSPDVASTRVNLRFNQNIATATIWKWKREETNSRCWSHITDLKQYLLQTGKVTITKCQWAVWSYNSVTLNTLQILVNGKAQAIPDINCSCRVPWTWMSHNCDSQMQVIVKYTFRFQSSNTWSVSTLSFLIAD